MKIFSRHTIMHRYIIFNLYKNLLFMKLSYVWIRTECFWKGHQISPVLILRNLNFPPFFQAYLQHLQREDLHHPLLLHQQTYLMTWKLTKMLKTKPEMLYLLNLTKAKEWQAAWKRSPMIWKLTKTQVYFIRHLGFLKFIVNFVIMFCLFNCWGYILRF